MPQSNRFPCIVCKRCVRDHEEAIACDKCSRWQHRTCGGLEELVTPCHYRLLCSGTLQFPWLCDGCDKRRRRHIAETTSPPPVPPILELELPQVEIPQEELVDKDEKPRVVGCSYRVSAFNYLATYAKQSFTPDVHNDSVLGTVTELVPTKSEDADLPHLYVKDEISPDTDSDDRDRLKYQQLFAIKGSLKSDRCDRKKHHHDEQEKELEEVSSKRQKRNNLPVATVLPMPKIEEDFTSEQPDYDDKDEEELEGSDLDDMCLVDLCSSDDDDSPPILERELPQVEIPHEEPTDKDEKPRVVGHSYPVSALTNLANYVEQHFTPTGVDHSVLGTVDDHSTVSAQIPFTSPDILYKSDSSDLPLLYANDEIFPDGDSSGCDRLKCQQSFAVRGGAENRLNRDPCDRKRHHHDEQEKRIEDVSSKRHNQRVATVLPMPTIEDYFSLGQPDYDGMVEEELEGSDVDDFSLVDLCSSDDDDDMSELVPVGHVINRPYDRRKLVTVGHVVSASRPGKQNEKIGLVNSFGSAL